MPAFKVIFAFILTQEFQPTKWEIWWIWSVSFVMHYYIGWCHQFMVWITCCLQRCIIPTGQGISSINSTHRMPRAKRKPWLQNCSSMSLGAVLDRKVNAFFLGWSHDPKETTIIFDFKNSRIYDFTSSLPVILDVIFNAMSCRKLPPLLCTAFFAVGLQIAPSAWLQCYDKRPWPDHRYPKCHVLGFFFSRVPFLFERKHTFQHRGSLGKKKLHKMLSPSIAKIETARKAISSASKPQLEILEISVWPMWPDRFIDFANAAENTGTLHLLQ